MPKPVTRLAALLLLPFGLAFAMERSGVIHTDGGPMQGLVANGIESYLGIPYAKAPVGDLRWRAPQPPVAWSAVLDASHFGANCSQQPARSQGPYTAEFHITSTVAVSEDCLFLNVWTPAARRRHRPVYVFLHGGSFTSGSGSIAIYDGSDLASRGVVVVTLNYRLGVFGFLAHPELTKESSTKTSGNYGLEDQIAALRWVHDNIAQFGGDPALVTVSGQSAGATAVNDLLVSKVAKGLFVRAIAESGSTVSAHVQTLNEAESNGVALENRAAQSGIEALRAISAAELLKLIAAIPPAPEPATELSFRPNVDGSVVAVNPAPEAAPESKVPLLTGFNASEGWPPYTESTTPAAFEADVRKHYGAFADRLLALYPHATDQEAADSGKMLGHDRIMAAMLIFSEKRASAGEIVYSYVFDHPYPIPLTRTYGSFHTGEVPYVFGALAQVGRVFTPADRTVSRQLQAYWMNFMLKGDPNGDGLPHWPRAGDSPGMVMGLGDHPGPQPAVSSTKRLALWEEFFAADQP